MKKLLFACFLMIKRLLFGFKFFGKSTIGRILYKMLRPNEILLVTFDNYKMFVNPKDFGVSYGVMANHEWEPFQTVVLKSLLKKNMIVVDVGANIGYYTIISSSFIGTKGKVYAFEPEESNYNLLEKNININNLTNAFPIKKALADFNGNINLYSYYENMGGPSIYRKNVSGKKISHASVAVTTLDHFFENKVKNYKVNLIKIDAQGAEYSIIKGMKKIIKRNKNLFIIMEYWPYGIRNAGHNPVKLFNDLLKCGFHVKKIDEKSKILEEFSLNDAVDLNRESELADNKETVYENLLFSK